MNIGGEHDFDVNLLLPSFEVPWPVSSPFDTFVKIFEIIAKSLRYNYVMKKYVLVNNYVLGKHNF